MQDNIIPADIGWSINYDRFSNVGWRRLEYELCMNLCVGWQYQLCKSPLSHGCITATPDLGKGASMVTDTHYDFYTSEKGGDCCQ